MATPEAEKDRLIEAVLNVLRRNPKFSKIEERNVKRILRKLELEDLTYLANVFDVYSEWLERTLSGGT
ncbi:MAG: hypothetical protein QXU69_08200 [Thermofilaceae archaeon]